MTDIISDLYRANIICSPSNNVAIYNANLANDLIIKAKITDFNNNPVVDKNITLSVDKGYFIACGGGRGVSESFDDTATKELTLYTKNDGTIHGLYAPTEVGLCTFKITVDSVEIASNQIFVYGWNSATIGNDGVKGYIRYNKNTRVAQFYLGYTGTAGANFYQNWRATYGLVVPSELRPITNIVIPGHKNGTSLILHYDTGKFDLYAEQTWDTTDGITFEGMWIF